MNKIATAFALTFFLAFASFGAHAQGLIVKLTDPSREDLPVGKGMTVTGTATIPNGYHLWVLVRRSDFDGVWWPQGEGKIDPITKQWRVGVTFGTEDDISWDFQVAAAVFNAEGHIILDEYRKRALKTGDWKPIEIPETESPPQILKVKKISHR